MTLPDLKRVMARPFVLAAVVVGLGGAVLVPRVAAGEHQSQVGAEMLRRLSGDLGFVASGAGAGDRVTLEVDERWNRIPPERARRTFEELQEFLTLYSPKCTLEIRSGTDLQVVGRTGNDGGTWFLGAPDGASGGSPCAVVKLAMTAERTLPAQPLGKFVSGFEVDSASEHRLFVFLNDEWLRLPVHTRRASVFALKAAVRSANPRCVAALRDLRHAPIAE